MGTAESGAHRHIHQSAQMSIRIIGAGMAGLLTAHMLRRHRPTVHEAQSSLPDNHGALLRFRTDAVARETGQEFRQVRVLKAIMDTAGRLKDVATLADNNLYAAKVSGRLMDRSILNTAPADRYIAPDDFLATMQQSVMMYLNEPLTMERLTAFADAGDIIISTIPMPVLMTVVGWPSMPAFSWRPVWSIVAMLPEDVNVYQTIYYPSPLVHHYRASITGRKLIIESMAEPTNAERDILQVLQDFGITGRMSGQPTPHIKRQEYGKLAPMDDGVRQEFILAMTDRHSLYSVGRFATWRQILLDDVVNDVRMVQRWIQQRTSYTRRLEQS